VSCAQVAHFRSLTSQTPAAEEGFPLSLANSTHMRMRHPVHLYPIGNRNLSLVRLALQVICSADHLLWTGLEVCFGQRRHLDLCVRREEALLPLRGCCMAARPASPLTSCGHTCHGAWIARSAWKSVGAKSAEPHEREHESGAQSSFPALPLAANPRRLLHRTPDPTP
jgi:hypothetical protein